MLIRSWDRLYWQTCQKIQKLVFPDGVKWDAEKRCYLTETVNPVFETMRSISDSYKRNENEKQDKSQDLSCVVAKTINFSNEWLAGFKAIVDFAEWTNTQSVYAKRASVSI